MKEILLKGWKHSAIVDDEDYDRVVKSLNTAREWYEFQGYARGRCKIDGVVKYCSMHQVVMNHYDPREKVIDHINGNTLDNRRENLRFATKSQNKSNPAMYRKDPDSPNAKIPYKGVYRNHQYGFKASIRVNKKAYNGGTYKTMAEAALAYNRLAIQHHGEFAKLNVIIEKQSS